MRRNHKKVVSCIVVTAFGFLMAGFAAAPAVGPESVVLAQTLEVDYMNGPLQEVMLSAADTAETVVRTQEFYKRAVSAADGETDICQAPGEDGAVIAKMYGNTIVDVLEKGDIWSKISSGNAVGYVKNERLAFGEAAVERADAVCPAREVQDGEKADLYIDGKGMKRDFQAAKTMQELEAEKAAEEAARKAAEALKKQAEEQAALEKDRDLLAALIFCEAGGEPYEGQVAVGAVVLNRVRSGIYPDSIREVIYQSGQFGPAITGKLDRVIASGRTTQSCYQAAAEALAGSNPIGSALYFGNGNYGQKIGGHWFH